MAALVKNDFAFPAHMALFLDFDGTLVGFKNDPETVHLSQAHALMLIELHRALSGAIAIISGRDVRDLAKRVPDIFWRLGNHGLYTLPPRQVPPAELGSFPHNLRKALTQDLLKFDGVWIENKGPMVAIHHREIPHAGPDIFNIACALIAADDSSGPDLVVQSGHNVVEIKPHDANKGKSITAMMKIPPFLGRTPVMIGDDNTDEDGFVAVQNIGGFGIKLGLGDTQAKYRVSNRTALYALLDRLS